MKITIAVQNSEKEFTKIYMLQLSRLMAFNPILKFVTCDIFILYLKHSAQNLNPIYLLMPPLPVLTDAHTNRLLEQVTTANAANASHERGRRKPSPSQRSLLPCSQSIQVGSILTSVSLDTLRPEVRELCRTNARPCPRTETVCFDCVIRAQEGRYWPL